MRPPANRALITMLAASALAQPAAVECKRGAAQAPEYATTGKEWNLGAWQTGGPPKPAYREGQRRRKRRRR